MADDSRSVSGTIHTVNDDGQAQVALQLAGYISRSEAGVAKNRDYWLNLYVECHHVVTHGRRKDEK